MAAVKLALALMAVTTVFRVLPAADVNVKLLVPSVKFRVLPVLSTVAGAIPVPVCWLAAADGVPPSESRLTRQAELRGGFGRNGQSGGDHQRSDRSGWHSRRH